MGMFIITILSILPPLYPLMYSMQYNFVKWHIEFQHVTLLLQYNCKFSSVLTRYHNFTLVHRAFNPAHMNVIRWNYFSWHRRLAQNYYVRLHLMLQSPSLFSTPVVESHCVVVMSHSSICRDKAFQRVIWKFKKHHLIIYLSFFLIKVGAFLVVFQLTDVLKSVNRFEYVK